MGKINARKTQPSEINSQTSSTTQHSAQSMGEVEIISLLKDDTRYNYYEQIKRYTANEESSLSGAIESPSASSPVVNTLELFAFGNYPHYQKYKSRYIDLDSELLLKLIKLTILAMCAENEGSIMLVVQMEKQYGIDSAILHYHDEIAKASTSIDSGAQQTCHLLESILYSMIDDSLINIKLDDKYKKIRIIKSYILRDCYNKNDITLKVLKEEDIPRNAGTSYAKLDKWLQENIKPVRSEYIRR